MILPVELRPRTPEASRSTPPGAPAQFGAVFERHLDSAQGLRFSAHAAQRLERRGIHLPEEEWARIGGAVDRAAEKGARESLVIAGDVALLISVPNRTVITALSPSETQANVFTRIDSAVVLPPRETATEAGPDPLEGSPNAADRTMRRNM